MKNLLKWLGLVLGGLFVLILVAALGLYLFAPDPVIVRSETQIAAPPEAVFEKFTDFDDWYELWDVVGITPPQEPIEAGGTFQFIEPDGTVVNGTITQYVEDRIFAAELEMVGTGAIFAFTLNLEPIGDGTHAVLHNEGKVGGLMKVMMAVYKMTGELDAYYDLVIQRLKTKAER